MAASFLAVLAAAVVVAGCAGDETPEPRNVAGLAGQIVEVDGRYLYFECVGSGSRAPTSGWNRPALSCFAAASASSMSPSREPSTRAWLTN